MCIKVGLSQQVGLAVMYFIATMPNFARCQKQAKRTFVADQNDTCLKRLHAITADVCCAPKDQPVRLITSRFTNTAQLYSACAEASLHELVT